VATSAAGVAGAAPVSGRGGRFRAQTATAPATIRTPPAAIQNGETPLRLAARFEAVAGAVTTTSGRTTGSGASVGAGWMAGREVGAGLAAIGAETVGAEMVGVGVIGEATGVGAAGGASDCGRD
jgi:hypothetical protein